MQSKLNYFNKNMTIFSLIDIIIVVVYILSNTRKEIS